MAAILAKQSDSVTAHPGDTAWFSYVCNTLMPLNTTLIEARGDTLRLLEGIESPADIVNRTGKYGDSRTIAKRILSPGLRDSLDRVERLIAKGDPEEDGACDFVHHGYVYTIRAGGHEYTCGNCHDPSCHDSDELRRIQAIGGLIDGIRSSFTKPDSGHPAD